MDPEEIGWNGFFQQEVDDLELAPGSFTVGRVIWASSGRYRLLAVSGEMEAIASGRLRLLSSSLPGVGDWVLVKEMETKNMIFHVLDRLSKISRKVPGKGSAEQLIAANIDLIFIVMGMDGDMNPRRLERYLVMVSGTGASPVVILNKSDVLEDPGRIPGEIADICMGVPVHLISAMNADGLDPVREYLTQGVTIAMVGSSGAGKSTLINALIGNELQITGEVREADSKGRHVTTSRELFLIPGGGMVIDNPGIREIQLFTDESSITEAFPDIEKFASGCRFKDCNHDSEPGCRVKDALQNGELSSSRYQNYMKMKKEVRYLMTRADSSSEAVEKKKWKPIMKGMKGYYKYKREG